MHENLKMSTLAIGSFLGKLPRSSRGRGFSLSLSPSSYYFRKIQKILIFFSKAKSIRCSTMQTTFENTEKQHLRRKELERHMQIISSAGGISDLEEFSDNLDIQGLADDMTGQPLTKVPIFADGSNSNRGRTKGRRVALAVAVSRAPSR